MVPTPPPFPFDSPFPAEDAKEPIATPTIAEIYLRQGLPHRALKVYRDLLLTDPGNGEIRRRLEALETRLQAEEEEEWRDPLDMPSEDDAVASDPAERQIVRLTLWLEAIHRRRQHVP